MIEKQMKFSEGIFWVAISAVICTLAFQIDLGSLRSPGPGFVAFLAGMLIGCVGVVMTFTGYRSKRVEQEADQQVPAIPWRRLACTIIFLTAYAFLMELIGYIISTVLVMFGLYFDWERRNWVWSAFFSIITTLVSYFVFEVWLRSQLPRGIFPWW